jgi:hypothetical protein
VTVGADGEQIYVWGDQELEFVRCGHCGCITHYRVRAGLSNPKVAVNFRLAEQAVTQQVPRRIFDGATML